MSSRLYVGNLAFHTTEESLREAFSQVGDVTEIHLVIDRMTGSSRGFAFVTMGSPDAARAAIQQLNGVEVDGRALRVDEAQERAPRGGGGGGGF
nr:RNA-binding protein [Myxococcota bacterium]